ncbi:FHA domain-containing protein [Nocardioides sp. GY 10113]|uniref:FHA domain-containing protein n=1 Tax=Nocardioides sp. GY 10113 TaxID=2569761 RepID=UPI0010A78D2D|nr:FHA domain-containing protein [Nocardioides sp. GY 10113]TIC88475.1 FHA domain-containing protein [Nocardioides sp. GY 10113]
MSVTSPLTWSYRPGPWFAVVGSRVTVLLPEAQKEIAVGLWASVDGGADFGEALDSLLASGLSRLPGFAVVSFEDGGARVLLRGAAVAAEIVADGRSVRFDGAGGTWVERTVADVTALSITVAPGEAPDDAPVHASAGAALDLPILTGLVRAGRVDHPARWATGPAGSSAAEAAERVAPAPVEPAAAGAVDLGPPTELFDGPSVDPLSDPIPDPLSDPLSDPLTDLLQDPLSDPLSDPLRDPLSDPLGDPWGDPLAGTGVADADADADAEPDADADAEPDAGEQAAEQDDIETGQFDIGGVGPGEPPQDPPPPLGIGSWERLGAPPSPPSAPPSAPPAPAVPPLPPPPAARPGTSVTPSRRAAAPPPSSPPPSSPPPSTPPPSAPPPSSPPPSSPPPTSPPSTPPTVPPTGSPVTLRVSDGQAVVVDEVVLIGRAPEARRFTGTEQPRLVAVPSRLNEISSTHIEVRPGAERGTALVTDMGSTNGTVLVRPGQGPEDLKPGIAVALTPGAIINLGDGITIQVS